MSNRSCKEIYEQFREDCQLNRLRVRKDEDRTPVVRGKFGDIYPWSSSLYAFSMYAGPTQRRKNKFKRFVPELFQVIQEGDLEACFTFKPCELRRVSRIVKCRLKRNLSDAQKERSRAILEKARNRALKDVQKSELAQATTKSNQIDSGS